MSTHNLLIFGATGLIGQHITRAIVAQSARFGRINLFTSQHTISTKSESIDALKQKGINIIVGDLNSEHDVKEAYAGVDVVISCLGRSALDKQVDLVRWADQHPDVKHFFPSEYGTDIEYSAASAHEKPHQHKLKVRAAFKEVKNLDHTYVVVGPYCDADYGMYLSALKPETEQFGTFNVKSKHAVLLGTAESAVSMTTMRDVGKFVAASILNLDKVKNKALHVNSFTSTPDEIVAEFEKQTGSKWQVSWTSLDELRKLESKAWEDGNPMATIVTLRRIWTEGGTLYDHRDNDVIGLETGIDSLQSAVAQAISEQLAGQ